MTRKHAISAALRLAAIAAAVFCAACTASDDDFITDNSAQQTFQAGEGGTIALSGGGSLVVPAGTFEETTVVIFSNFFSGGEINPALFPTASQETDDLFAGAVINTPVDIVLRENLTLTFNVLADAQSRIVKGGVYNVYRFDFDNARWNQWGSVTATVNAAGTAATVTLPTDGFRGFVGSVAIFEGHVADDPVTPTTISGTVIADGGGGISTDVGVYVSIGGLDFPVSVSNGRVPDLTDAEGAAFTLANTVDSAANGTFTIQVPENLIGQLVSLKFGAEDDAFTTQDGFDILAPANEIDDVESMTVRYGVNNVRSQPVTAGSS